VAVAVAIAVAIAVAACAMPAPSAAPPTEPPATQAPVQASPNQNLVAFTTHIREATSREGQIVRDLAAAQTGSKSQLRLVAHQLATWASDEQAWLEANIADSCYEPAWQSWSDGVTAIAAAATGFTTLADVALPSPETGQAAASKLAQGGDALKAAADLADQARAACR
jgi:hypothetical protein